MQKEDGKGKMRCENVTFGRFLDRPNRFLARVERDRQLENCHVKNTSRLRELLRPGALVALQAAGAAGRKTAFDLIAVEHQSETTKEPIWVNIDSQAPNKVCKEWLMDAKPFGEMQLLRPESTYGHYRFDFYLEAGERKIFLEVKGVTLVEGGVARFPGAPTLRGVKHLEELADCLSLGYEAAVVFVAKRADARAVAPNDEMKPAFGQALRRAVENGVQAVALNCDVQPDALRIAGPIDLIL
mgnify:CR=1 FL=1